MHQVGRPAQEKRLAGKRKIILSIENYIKQWPIFKLIFLIFKF